MLKKYKKLRNETTKRIREDTKTSNGERINKLNQKVKYGKLSTRSQILRKNKNGHLKMVIQF